jgi:DNA-binding Lrp family transcriptional regulator
MNSQKKIQNRQFANILKNIYTDWKRSMLETSGYFVIFKPFQNSEKLKHISGNALKLYVYLGLNSNNYTGEVWHSNKKIATYFGKSERTVRGWMQELESLNLIKRFQLEYNKESHTYLQPYSSLDYFEPEKYIYTYRIKNVEVRNSFNLSFYYDEINQLILKLIPKIYVNVKKDYIRITCYSPLKTNTLTKLNKELKQFFMNDVSTSIDDSTFVFERFFVKKKDPKQL